MALQYNEVHCSHGLLARVEEARAFGVLGLKWRGWAAMAYAVCGEGAAEVRHRLLVRCSFWLPSNLANARSSIPKVAIEKSA